MPNTYTTKSDITLSRDSFVLHYMAVHMAMHPEVDPTSALAEAEMAWEQIEDARP